MSFNIKYLPEVIEDIKNLDNSVKAIVFKGLSKVSKNPVSKANGGYGEPLGNLNANNLCGLYKIKFRAIGIRAVYALQETDKIMTVVVVSLRADNKVYDEAAKRRKKHSL